MTSRKDLKRRVRERQKQTGERYTAALAKVRARKDRGAVAVTELHDATAAAEAAGLRCRAVLSDALWRTEFAEPGGRGVQAMFERLRSLATALEGDAAAAPLCAAVLRGEAVGGVPNAVRESMGGLRFMAQVRAGVRGVSATGRIAAFDVAAKRGPITAFCVLIAAPGGSRRPVLWLAVLGENDANSSGFWEQAVKDLALAGIGGVGER